MSWWEDKVEKPLSDAGNSIRKEVKSCFSGGCDPAMILNKAAKGASKNTSQGFAQPIKEEFNEAVDHLFNEKLNPFADKVDYIAQKRIAQSQDAAKDVVTHTVQNFSDLKNQVKGDVDELIANVDDLYKENLRLTFEEINQARAEAILGLRAMIGDIDTSLEETIIQSVDALLSKGLSDIQSIKQGPLAPGTEIVREVHPLALATNDEFIDVNGQWIAVTRPVYSTYDYTATLPGTQRKYKLIVRQANDGQAPRGDVSKYRLFYPWVNNADNTEYPGNLNWGSLDEGGWDTITLDHITNPFNQDKHGNSYWRLEGFTSNCTNRVFSVTLMVVDIIS